VVCRLSRTLPEYDLANMQLCDFSNGRFQGFPDEAEAAQAEAQRVSKCAGHTQDLLLATDSRVISLYVDGFHSEPDGSTNSPTWLDGGSSPWNGPLLSPSMNTMTGYTVTSLTLCTYHGADHNNNKGELTAIGKAITWINL